MNGSPAPSGDRPLAVAFYLPQFHPIPENDEWWGRGFTEWHNVVRGRPLFPGHEQPRIPADLGFYDLRLPEVREAQADLARAYGIDAFCYYHYWFAGRRLLHRPIDDVLASGRPDHPFCLAWANEPWRANWDGRTGRVLVEQHHSADDDREHIEWLLKAFADPRYLRIDGRPLFLVYRAGQLPDPRRTTDLWREEAERAGVGELLLCRVASFHDEHDDPRPLGFDAAVEFQPDWRRIGPPLPGFGPHRVYDYGHVATRMLAAEPPAWPRFPGVTPRWDNTARNPQSAVVLAGATPERYRAWLATVADRLRHRPRAEQVVFVNAWNEWAEGAHLEPCRRWGHGFLEAHRDGLVPGGAVHAGTMPAADGIPGPVRRRLARIAR